MFKIYSDRIVKFLLTPLIIILIFITAAHSQISTFAGRNTYLGDGGTAKSAGLFGPYAIARDASGNLYIATSKDNRVRKITASTGIITTIAGTGIAGFSGDNGPATAAQFHFNGGGLPGIAVDASGNIYIGDYLNDRIRKITASTGIITTIAGSGVDGYSGDGGAAAAATMSGPAGVQVDASGNVYFADNNNSLIRKLTLGTNGTYTISTVAGSYANGGFYSGDGGAATAAGLSYPERFCFDSSGNMYIADQQNFCIRKVTASTKIITTIAGTSAQGTTGDGGAATSATFGYIVGIAADASGNIYVADPTYNRVRKITASTKIISTVAGTGTAAYTGDGGASASATLNQPSDVLADASGNIYIDDNGNSAIRLITAATGVISTYAGDGTNGFTGVQASALKAQLAPQGIALSANGDMLIADGYYYDVRDINTAGTAYIYAGNPNPDPAFASKGTPVAGVAVSTALFNAPVGVTTDASNNVYIADVYNNVIRQINYNAKTVSNYAGTGTAGYSGDGGAATSAMLKSPWGVAADKSGNIYIADAGNNRIRMVAASTKYISTIAGTGTAGFSGDGAAATAALISGPTAVAVDGSGNVFFIDKGNARVRRVDATTKYISTILSNGHVLTGIATDASGNIYVSDSTAYSVLQITPGTFSASTIAGTGAAGYTGDGSAATSASLNYPGGLMVDASGNVYVADVKNGVIRKFKPSTTTVAAIANNIISTGDSTVTCTGKISLTTLSGTVPTGGTGTYTYQWKQSADSVTFSAITGATAQNYAVNTTITAKVFYRRYVTSGTLVDSGNAIGFRPRTVPVPSISLGKGTTTFCQGLKDTLTATAGYVKYAWSNGVTTNPFIDSVSGTFSVTVTDSFGCKGTSAAVVVTVNAAPSTPTITSSPATTTNLCPGTTVTLTSSTGTTYKWSTGATTAAVSVTAAGSYTDTVYNASGCKAYSAAVTVSYTTAPATPTVTSSPATTTNLCPGTTVTLTSSTGTTYKWSTGATTAAISVTAAGSYTDTVYNASGCKAYSAPVTVSYTTAPATPTITSSPATTTNLCPGTTVTLTSSTGTTYKWSTGATTAAISVTAAGSYTDTVYNASGCKAYSAAVTVSYTTAPATPTITSSPATTTNLCPGTTVTLTSSTGTTYKWSTGATTAAISVTAAGSYTDTVYNASGCKAYSAAVTVSYTTAPATPTITSSPATTTNLCPGTTVTLTSSTGTTYKWSTGATTAAISVTAAGSYTDTVYNASGCKAYSTPVTVSYTTAPATPTITSSPATTTNLCPGTTVTLTSSTGTTYKWSTGATTAAISVTAAGSYTDTVYNASGCKAYSAPVTVSYTTAPATPTITSSPATTTNLCPGTTVTLTSSTGTTYKWSTGATTAAISVTAAGSYTDTVYNASGCKAYSAPVTVSYTTAPATPTITSSPATTTNLCPGTTVTLTSSTGTTYKWSTGATTAAISVTAAGSYTDTVYNASGCKAYSAAKVVSYTSAPATPTVTSSPATTTNLCPGTTVTLTSSTGTTYKWSTGATTAAISVTAAGSYTDTVYNASGCKAYSAPVTVSYTTAPATPTITSSPATTTNLCPGTTVTLTSSTGTTYKWSTGATTSAISVTAAGSYTDTVYNASGCKAYSAAKVVSYVACATPASPTTGTAAATTATLSWRSVPCAVQYYLQYALSSSTTWTTVTLVGSTDTTYTITGLTKATAYKWQVASVCTTTPTVTTSAYTTALTFTTAAASTVIGSGGTSSLSAGNLPTDNKPFDAVVYPNPAVNTANVVLSGTYNKVIITITDLSGKAVWQSETTAAKQVVVPVSNLAAGMYFITIKNEKYIKVLKLLKQ